MPIYVYECECGAVLESLEKVGAARATCGELCARADGESCRGEGKVEKVLHAPGIRGAGHDAQMPTVDVHKRAGRRFDDCA